MKERIDKLDFIKIKIFYPVKDTVKRMKAKPQTERKYLQKDISDKGLLSKIYIEL